jgi:hypothetical protein
MKQMYRQIFGAFLRFPYGQRQFRHSGGMTMLEHLERARAFRDHAEKLRRISAGLDVPEDRNVFEQAAREIDRIAKAEAANDLVRLRGYEEQLPLARRRSRRSPSSFSARVKI